MNAQKDVKHRCIFSALALRTNEEDAVGFHAVTGVQTASQVLFTDAENAFRLNATFHLLRKFLEFNKL